jgi:CcmD family protein
MNFLLEPGLAIYMALAVALVVWIGIFAFLWRLDRQTRALRQRLEETPRAAHPPHATLEPRNGHPQSAPIATNNE